MDDSAPLPVPREAARGAAHWPRSVWRASDAYALACEARRLCSAKLRQARHCLTVLVPKTPGSCHFALT